MIVKVSDKLFAVENTTLADVLKEVTQSATPRMMLVADANVVHRTDGLGTSIGAYVKAHGITLAGAPVVTGGGEKVKTDNFLTIQRILNAAIEAKIGVTDAIVVLGGGSVLDVATYAAAQVRGGVKLIKIPTTPAAMMDGAFANDGAMDTPVVKDAFRLKYDASAVLIDTAFAKTVLDGVWRGGVGEVVRYAAVRDGALLRKVAKKADDLKNRGFAALDEVIKLCVESRLKKGSTDFALWSTARLEAMSNYKLPHGYAVPIGICIDCAYAVDRGYMDEDTQDLVCRTLADLGALDGLTHSRHLFQQATTILYGLDSWRLSTGSESIVLPAGLGKARIEETPDRAAYEKVIKAFYEASAAD